MKIIKQNQYNQGVGKNKLLSSTAGVGSIITTKVGSYVLISNINQWKFFKWANTRLEIIRSENSDERDIYVRSKSELSNRGLNFVDDQRFVKFLKYEKGLENLTCLVGIPHMSLNESFNTPNWKNHPIKAALDKAGEPSVGASNHYMINGTHFPKWFKNSNGELKLIHEWLDIWTKECRRYPDNLKLDYFAPPRDATKFLSEIKIKNEDGNEVRLREYKPLEQTNLILICPNGHLSDIPWPNYLRWKTEKFLRLRPEEDKGENLLSSQTVGPCCSNPRLKWTESKTKSEGYSSIYVECLSCGLGSGGNDRPKISLEGINSIEPCCQGHKPWELEIDNPGFIPSESCFIRGDRTAGREKMKVALVTANNVYYANGFSSLFIPVHIAENKPKVIIESKIILEKRYQRHFEKKSISREEYWNLKFDLEDFLLDNGLEVSDQDLFEEQLRTEFFEEPTNLVEIDRHEEYRWQEYRCFSNFSSLSECDENRGIRFKDITLPDELKGLFKKIQQVEELKVTNVQLDFTRVKPKERIVVNGIVQESSGGQNIFSSDPNNLYVLPANETFGEGIFFEFSNESIDEWIKNNLTSLNDRLRRFISQIPERNSQGISSKMRIFNNQYKQFLIHSFSHLMMRELEFSCGYPTASLKERLYISRTPEKLMSGVLIYTSEGSEGSMGGLVSQGEPDKILEIIKKGLTRSENCSSDPLCWESDGQGIFDLNLAACFSCSLVSETACEEMNLGLDRRILIDDQFGYFKEI